MKTIELTVRGTVDSNAELLADVDAEIEQKSAAVTTSAQTLVASLRAAGVNVQRASLVFAPRAGSHDAPLTTDLNAEPAGGGTETVSSGN